LIAYYPDLSRPRRKLHPNLDMLVSGALGFT
jgi:hypothetical protein